MIDEIKEEAQEEKPKKKRAISKSKEKKLCRKVGGTVSVYRTEDEMKAEGGEWEILD